MEDSIKAVPACEMVRARATSLSLNWDRMLNMLERKEKALKPPANRVPVRILDKPPFSFCTGSVYIGTWNIVGMAGDGMYRMPHHVIYEGEILDGMFHGEGTLHYPNGCKVEGIWELGRMVQRKFVYSDGDTYEDGNFRCCKKPDRRFTTEKSHGLKPAGRSQITNSDPPRRIPDGCYDAGEGFYNPMTKCLMNPKTGEVMRIPTRREEEWIMTKCRKAEDENVGFRPRLYEDWYPEITSSSSSSEDEIITNLKKYSVVGSTVAFTPSQLAIMTSALRSESVSYPTDKSSSLMPIGGSNVAWIYSSSGSSMDRDAGQEFQFKVNTEFAKARESVIGTINEKGE